MKELLNKPQNQLTDEDKKQIDEYLNKYEPVFNHLDKLMKDIIQRLNGEDPIPEYTASPTDIAIGRLKSTMKSLKREVTRVFCRLNTS